MMKTQLIFGIGLIFALSACSQQLQPGTIQLSPETSENLTIPKTLVLGSAFLKRSLTIKSLNGMIQPLANIESPDVDFKVMQFAAPEPAVATDIAIAPGYYYGGHDFNQYTIHYAEENFYPRGSNHSLLSVYNQEITKILSEWDKDSRLLEARGQVNNNEIEYIQLPGRDGEPMQVKPEFVFRFASTPKKETLNIYVLAKEIRVHRMVWGESNIEIGKVKVDSDTALDIARKAFANQSNSVGYPIYPADGDLNVEKGKIIYDLPSDLHWTLNLNQQNKDKLVYFLHFQFQTEGEYPANYPADKIYAEDDSVPNSQSSQAFRQYLNGSIQIDAISGKILQLNRPVIYYPYHGDQECCFDEPLPAPVPLPAITIDAAEVK